MKRLLCFAAAMMLVTSAVGCNRCKRMLRPAPSCPPPACGTAAVVHDQYLAPPTVAPAGTYVAPPPGAYPGPTN